MFSRRAELVDADCLERKRLENEIDILLDDLIENLSVNCGSWNRLVYLRDFLLTQTKKKWKSKRYQKVKAKVRYVTFTLRCFIVMHGRSCVKFVSTLELVVFLPSLSGSIVFII